MSLNLLTFWETQDMKHPLLAAALVALAVAGCGKDAPTPAAPPASTAAPAPPPTPAEAPKTEEQKAAGAQPAQAAADATKAAEDKSKDAMMKK